MGRYAKEQYQASLNKKLITIIVIIKSVFCPKNQLTNGNDPELLGMKHNSQLLLLEVNNVFTSLVNFSFFETEVILNIKFMNSLNIHLRSSR